MTIAALPNRRTETWKYSDLRRALTPIAPALVGDGHVIEQLSAGAGRPAQRVKLGPGEHRLQVLRLDADGFDPHAEEAELAPGAMLDRIVLQGGAGEPLSFFRARLEHGARLRCFVLAEGGALARIETEVEVAGVGGEVELSGIYLAAPGRHADLTSTVFHRAERGATRQLVKGVVRDRGRGVFQGRIVVERAAQKTDARQHHQALLLEDGGEIDAKPALEIYADDVACAHGAAIGGLDPDQIFYLRARGLEEAQARAVLMRAFLADAMPAWAAEALGDEIESRIDRWLSGEAS